ncbi:MAG: FAD-dependent oxidoreductase [Gemmatimonadota bacterium]|nr:FAD-dependent oxidoreductase [Gemmatimonadota bacterium]
MNAFLPSEARVVIVGGGIVGCSVAYHLTRLGWGDVVLLEQGELSGGTTWHAAGLIGRLRTSNSLTRINKYSAELYASLEAETGQSTGWNQVGSLIVARSEERMIQLHRTAAMAELFGVEARIISVDEAVEKWPLMDPNGLRGGVWLPHDGKVVPKDTTLALAAGARQRGAQIIEQIRVDSIETAHGRAIGVRTPNGSILSDCVVLCGGMWTRELGLRCGVTIPLYPVEHHYIVSEPIEGAHDNLPVGRDPDTQIYFRSEGDAIMLGAFQLYSKPWMVDRIPDDFSFQLLEPDWDKYQQPLEAGQHLIPALKETSFPKFVNGPESFTPDNNFIMGEAPGVSRLFVAAGFNSVGIASGGGAGKYLAEWIDGGEAPMDLWSVDIRRFMDWQNNPNYLRNRVTEVLGLHYQMAWPNREFETARDIRRSTLHERLAARGACFGSKLGWERPNWFAPVGVTPEMVYSFGKQNWFDHVGAEVRATRDNVALFDQSSFAKYLLHGEDALQVLQRVCGNNIDVSEGQVVYTGMFNERGTFESDLTVVRLTEQNFYLITSTAQAIRDFDWIFQHINDGEQADLTDVTTTYSVLGVMGPQAPLLLGAVGDVDFSQTTFPFGTSQEVAIGPITVGAVRITYVGESGWELHIPAEQAGFVYDTLMEAGRAFDLANAGHYAINCMRLEKAYRAWGADISPDDTPLEAGLSFAIDWGKNFIGRDALLELRQDPLTKRLAIFVLQDPGAVLWGNEPILRDGVPVGYTTSGAYGYTLGAAVGMGFIKHADGVDSAFIRNGRYEIETNGRLIPATVSLRAPYDPDRKRILT